LCVFLDQAVEPVLDLNLGSALNFKTDFVPLVSHRDPKLQYLNVLVESPFDSLDIGVNDIDPALTALPWLPLRLGSDELIKLLSDAGPFLRLVHVNSCFLLLVLCDLCGDAFQDLSFMSCPRRLLTFNLLNEQPALLALLH